MDNFDKNQVDKDLLERVDEVLNGKHVEETPELVFSEEMPKDYDISQDNSQQGWSEEMPQGETWQDLKNKRNPKKKSETLFQDGTMAIFGFIIGILAIVAALTGRPLSIFPVILGLYFSKSGLTSNKRVLALAGLVMNIIGAVIFVYVVIRGMPL